MSVFLACFLVSCSDQPPGSNGADGGDADADQTEGDGSTSGDDAGDDAGEDAADASTDVGDAADSDTEGDPSSPVHVHPTRTGLFAGGRDNAEALTFAGAHTWFNIINRPSRGIDDNDSASFDDFLDFMESHGHNFTRIWSGFAYMDCYPHPWLREGPGIALDGEPKFDLSHFDEAYFDTLRERLTQLQDRGLYASVIIFGSHNGFDLGWTNIAWHPDNNVNDIGLDPEDGRSFFDLDNDSLRELQEALIRRYVDELNGLDNIIFEIMNEAAFPESAAWQRTMVEFAQDYEISKPRQHLFGITADYVNSNAHLVDGPHDWWSPDADRVDGYDYREGGPAAYDAKPVVVDSDHFDGGLFEPSQVARGVDRMWKVFLRGNHPILMECYTAIGYDPEYGCSGGVNPAFDPIRDALGAILEQANRFGNLADTIPSETVCSTAYCLVNAGQDYLAYQPDSGNIVVDLEPGDYQYEWTDSMTQQHLENGEVTSTGGLEVFEAPQSGRMLLWISAM